MFDVRKHPETIPSLQLQSQTNCKDISLISSHNTVYALTLVYIQYPDKAWCVSSPITKSYICSRYNRTYSYTLVIIWNLISCATITKRRDLKKTKKQTWVLAFAGCHMLWELWSEVLLPRAPARQIQALLSIVCALWRCLAVAVVIVSFRTFYDWTLIVKALFYTVISGYSMCCYTLSVWGKLNKCCLKFIYFSMISLNSTLTFYWIL